MEALTTHYQSSVLQSTGTLQVYGHSMYPKYPSGSIVAFKAASKPIPVVILWGEDYVIELEDRRIIKRVHKSGQPGHIQVNSYNDKKDEEGNFVYSPFDIPMKAIKGMYTVVGKIVIEAF